MDTTDTIIVRRIRQLEEQNKFSANVSFPTAVGEKRYQCKLVSAQGDLIETVQFEASDPFEAANICVDARNWVAMGKS